MFQFYRQTKFFFQAGFSDSIESHVVNGCVFCSVFKLAGPGFCGGALLNEPYDIRFYREPSHKEVGCSIFCL